MVQPMKLVTSTEDFSQKIERIKTEINNADAVLIGAGAGLSTSAGFLYSGERFEKYFGDFGKKYGFRDMYSGGFYPYKTLEERWAYWSRYVYVNRYMDAPMPLYQEVLSLVSDKDYFVLTTNVDHCFQKAGFDKNRLFYTQGDYSLFQCSKPCHEETYDNEEMIRNMVLAQGYKIAPDNTLIPPEDGKPLQYIPSELLPNCPKCGRPMTMNLRADETFVEDAGWHLAASRYSKFVQVHQGQNILFLELGVGYNTPGIIKYPFWQLTAGNPNARYVCINKGEAFFPEEIKNQAVGIDGDIRETVREITKQADVAI